MKGLKHDREWALFDASGQVMTGRNYPQLLDVEVSFDKDKVQISVGQESMITFNNRSSQTDVIDAKVFSYDVKGRSVNSDINQWFSEYLNQEAILMHSSKDFTRPVLPKHGGLDGDVLRYADQAPLLLMSMESLEDLNKRMEDHKVTYHHFRPNIVISGCHPYEEETWKVIKIGDVSYRIIQKCERCVFTTIDPHTKTKNRRGEPLRTLATYRKNPNGGVDFGVHLVPLNEGRIYKDDVIKISTSS